MPELFRALQQQRTLLIYIEEPAVQGRGLQLHPDRLAERHRPCQPSRAYRSEAVLTPTPLGPFGKYGFASSAQAVPAMSRWTHGKPPVNSFRNIAAVIDDAGRPPVFMMSAMSLFN